MGIVIGIGIGICIGIGMGNGNCCCPIMNWFPFVGGLDELGVRYDDNGCEVDNGGVI